MGFWFDPIQSIDVWLRGLLFPLGLPNELITVLLYTAGAFILATGAMLWVMILIWYERKLIGRVQDRFGPNRTGPWGVFQSIADMIKIFTKEHIIPSEVDWVPYTIAPVIAVAAVLMIWAVVPFGLTIFGVDLDVAVLFIIAVGNLGELGIVFAGWGSNNKFALLASFRAVAQLVSYEVPMVLALLLPVMFAGSLSMNAISQAQTTWYIFLLPLAAVIFFISSVAEVGRSPFDLTEAESELVSGFNVEYSGLKFGMFYVADFLHAFTIAMLFAVFFLGGWRGPGAEAFPLLGIIYLMIKTSLAYLLVILLRASSPRFRIDQMMDLNWKYLTPLMLALVALVAVVNKLVPETMTLVRVLVLLTANGLVFWVGDVLLGRSIEAQRKKKLSVFEKRPVAMPDVDQANA